MSEDLHPAPVSGAWDSALLGPVAEINEQMLECLRAMAVEAAATDATDAGGAAPRLVTQLCQDWRRLDAKAQRRLSACPCLLLDAGFAQPQRWELMAAPSVMDATVRRGYFSGRGGVALVRRTLVLAWHLARSNRVSARVILGMSALSAERIANARLADLEALAELAPGWIVPRWEAQPNVWRQLIAAACRGQPLLLRQAQLRGLQLLARAAGGRREGDG
ncbi:MAG TPA: hypothetical protein VHN17_00760 [Steroidobacteraceae bacterium]|jgi:hypothetical protein|nr:hypothetical protein [Steroidobacteraceae bacterium]